MPDALQLLREDHQKVKDLFKRFEDSDDKREKQTICDEAMMELVVHSTVEEEIFYPAVRAENRDGESRQMMDEADEEHHVVDLLIAELGAMTSSDSHFDAKFTVLAENVKHHIQEEESEMLPKAAELGGARMAELGDEMYARKMELMREMQGGRSRNGRSPNGRRVTGRKTTARKSPRTAGGRTSARGRTVARTTARATGRTTAARKTTSRNGSTESRRTTRTGPNSTARKAARGAARTPTRKTATRKAAPRRRAAAARTTGRTTAKRAR